MFSLVITTEPYASYDASEIELLLPKESVTKGQFKAVL